jgi:hypothetical protein
MTPPLATIGYETSTLPRVIEALQAAKVDLLLDVRAVAASAICTCATSARPRMAGSPPAQAALARCTTSSTHT